MQIIKKVSTSSLILGTSFILRFSLTFILARVLNSEQLGIYSWVISAFGVAVVVSNFGVDFFLIKKIQIIFEVFGK